MKLTIITVNLNNATGLEKTMQSVFSQIFKEFEYIVVDGASNDGSVDILQQFNNSTIQQFNWISEPDTGVYQAMNKGIRMASGKYLLFLNSGDFLLNEHVLENVFAEKDYSEDILCGQCNVSDNGQVIWTSNPPNEITFGTLYNVGLAHQSTFIKRALFNQFGYYREDFRYNSDIDFWYKAIIQGACKTRTLHKLIADYNLDGISSKQNQSEKYKNEIDEILRQFLKFTPDYDNFNKEKVEMEMYYWIKEKTILRKSLYLIYQTAKSFKKKK